MAADSLRFLGGESVVEYTCEINNKVRSVNLYLQYMFDRTNAMFKYFNLPDTIPEPMLEYMLQIYGSVTFAEVNDSLYAFRASYGGPPDPYYRPTQAIVANPGLGISQNYRITNHLPPFARDEWDSLPPCVRFLNDSQIQGLLPLFYRYAIQLVENDVSIRVAQINTRDQTTIVASTGPELESAKKYIQDLVDGKLGVIGERPFLEGVKITKGVGSTANVVMQLIELQQYLKASWYNDIGLNSNFNMKSQYISSEEINSSADIMLPLIDNMFLSRQSALESINKQFGTNISVEKDSAWRNKQIQAELGVAIDPVSGDILPGAEDGITISDLTTTSSSESSSTTPTEEPIENEESNNSSADTSYSNESPKENQTVIIQTDSVVIVNSGSDKESDSDEESSQTTPDEEGEDTSDDSKEDEDE